MFKWYYYHIFNFSLVSDLQKSLEPSSPDESKNFLPYETLWTLKIIFTFSTWTWIVQNLNYEWIIYDLLLSPSSFWKPLLWDDIVFLVMADIMSISNMRPVFRALWATEIKNQLKFLSNKRSLFASGYTSNFATFSFFTQWPEEQWTKTVTPLN